MTPERDKLVKYFADLGRVCELEDTVVEWFEMENLLKVASDALKDHRTRQIDSLLSQLKKQFDIEKVEAGGIDFCVWKIHLKVRKLPLAVTQYYTDLNIEIASFRDEPLTNEVKKLGVIIDRG